MIRSALLVTLGVAITAFFSFWSVVFSIIPNSENRIHKIANLWAKVLLLISNTKVEIIGKENILRNKPQIFMANHQSDFDILIVLGYIPGQFRWIAKKELFHIPIFGAAMRNAGYIEIDRHDHAKALQSLDEAAMRIREGKSVMSFPEGTRSPDGEIKMFKQGVFHLAIKSGVPVVPVSIVGSGKIMPKRSLKVTPGKVKLVIAKPIDIRNYTLENRHELIAHVRQIIIRNYDSWKEAGSANIKDKEKDAC
ncbi:MAG TPA: lysophospholipid acyltransferase family protein [Smithellaceae bacterium]|nr:lysophospholipid acyltransferase family protein [Smithellaceae bacterium]